ncbi:MAG TPA: AAA family ATPase, partial [Patescibacteria group bacterium]|nr:AAA family ATPase [Patescibacteria group bacterium]
GIKAPSLVVQSSGPGHEHWYWRLTEPITSIESVESRTKWLAYEFNGDYGCWNANRVLRSPGTNNHKRDKTTTVKIQESTAYPLDSFPLTDIDSVDDAESPSSVIPDVADVILQYAWPSDAIALYRTQTPHDRSNALMALGYHCAEMGMADAEIYSVVRNADDRWGKFKGRTDRHKRLLDLVTRVRLKYPIKEVAEDVYPVFGFRSLLSTEIELSWVIPGLLEANGYMLLVGPSGVGKTQWSLRWAINLALGRNFLGFQISDPQRILFVSCEMNHAGIKYFMDIMAKDMSDADLAILEENFLIAPIGEPLFLDTPDGQSVLTDLIEYHKPNGFIFDSMGSATSGDLSSEGPVKAIMGFNDHLRNKYDIWTWYIHHQRKAQGDNKKPNKLSDVYGNQYLVNRATSVVCLWPMKDRIEVIDLKIRLSPQSEPWEIQRLSNLDFVKIDNVKIVPKTLEY